MQRAKKIVLTVLGFAAFSSFLAACGMSDEGDEGNIDQIQQVDDIGTDPYGAKVTVCHRTGSKANPSVVIEIALSALPAHLAHGDTVGSTCSPTCVPSAEVCGDSIDNDCDGLVDEDCTPPPPPPVCTPGSTAACYDGASGTDGVGACHAGVMTCATDGSGYGACSGEVTPATGDACGDGVDNDCNGTVDEGCCVPSTEVCGDSIDNDCDGIADEGCLGDHVWADDNFNGVQEDGETGIAGATLYLRSSATGALLAVAVTDTNGNYYFNSVPAGTYFIEITPPPGYAVSPMDATSTSDALDSDFDPDLQATDNFTVFADGHSYDIDCGLAIIIGG